MARIFMSGFETGNLSEWDGSTGMYGSYAKVVQTNVHTGLYSLMNDMFQAAAYKNLSYVYDAGEHFESYHPLVPNVIDTGLHTLYGSFWFRWEAWSGTWGSDWFGTNAIFWISGEWGAQVSFGWRSWLGKLEIYRGMAYDTYNSWGYSTPALLGSTPEFLITPSTWHLIEFKVYIHHAYGIVQVKVNQDLVVDLSNVNTRGDLDPTLSRATTNINRVYLGYGYRSNGATDGNWDDFVLDTSEWTNGGRIMPLPLTGNGSINLWTPSSGLNYSCVDEVPYNDSDYVQTYNVNDVDVYAKQALPDAAYNVSSVLVTARTWKDGGNSDLTLTAALKAGMTVFAGSQNLLNYNPLLKSFIWETNPLTGNDFIADDFNSTEFGIQLLDGLDLAAGVTFLSLLSGTHPILKPWLTDSSCKAIWLFEDPENIGLNVNGFSNLEWSLTSAPSLNYTDFKQGSCSLQIDALDQPMFCQSANLAIDFPFYSASSPESKLTAFGWFKPSHGSYAGLFGGNTFGMYTEDTTNNLYIYLNSYKYAAPPLSGITVTTILTGVSLDPGTWYHVAMTYDNSNLTWSSRIFNDSTGITTARTGLANGTVTGGFGYAFYMGACYDYYNHYVNSFQGLIDKVMVFDRVLSDVEIDSFR
jgi:hypothetical protein